MAQPRGKAVKLYLGAQADLETVAPAASYINTYAYSVNPSGTQPFEDDPILGGNFHNDRDATEPAPGLVSADSSLSVPACVNHLGHWLKGAFGAPVFTADTPVAGVNQHRFESGSDTLPHRTLAYELNGNADARRLVGFVVGALSWNVSRSGGFSRVEIEGAARKVEKVTDLATDLGAVPAADALRRYPAYRGIVRVDGVASANLLTAAPKYDNQLDLVEFATNDEFIGDICPGDAKFNCPISVRYQNSAFYDRAVDAFNGAAGLFPVELEWQFNTNEKLLITLPNCRVAPSAEPVTGPGGIEVSYELMAEQSASQPMVTVDLFNQLADGTYI